MTAPNAPFGKRDLLPVKIKWLVFFAVLLGPAISTMLIASFKSPNLTSLWVLAGSPIAGIVSGVMLSRACSRNVGVRVLLALVFAFVLSAFCLISCFFSCGLAGGGGIKFGG